MIASERAWSFVHFDLFINKAQFDAGVSERFKLKDDDVPDYIGYDVTLNKYE